jgi:hypothetical protein
MSKISEREAVKLSSPLGGQGIKRCKCKSDCSSKKCSRSMNTKHCTIFCHRGNSKCINCEIVSEK